MNPTILLVEDDENDVFFMQRAFKEAGILHPVQVAKDGAVAIDYLAGHGQYADRHLHPLPCVTLLDLKLPQVMGLEVLRWIREQPQLRSLIVIVLTSSRLTPDVQKAYDLGANAYLVKPNSPANLRQMALEFKHFWLELNHFPAESQVFQKTL